MQSVPRPGMIRLTVLFLSVCLAQLSAAQDTSPVPPAQTPPPRPRIGLALGGGAALGLSEIGIIRWMEDNHVPVDRIAGTSMGSIIGAMYATGMSSQEIEKFAEQIKWDEAFRAEPAYPELSYRRKQDRRDYQIEPLLGLKHGLTGPNGFNPGQRVELLLDRIAYSEYAIHNFDELPIPFRCVATDMLSGQAVVLRDGPLGQAVRASMAIPGVFTPVEVNGRVLADGGMVQNVPVETVREMGVDAVIAVQLQTPPGTREQLETLTGMLSRAVSVMITQNEERSMALADAKVTVDTTGFDVTDYGRVKEFIALGYKAAASNSTGLLRYAIQDDAWKQYLSEREARRHRRSEKVAAIAIQVTGSDADTDRRIKNRLTSALHEPLDLDQLHQQMI